MRIVYFANNRLGWWVGGWLREHGEQIVRLVLHHSTRRNFGADIMRAAGVAEEEVLDGSQLRERETLEAIQSLHPDIGLSVMFGYLLPPAILQVFPGGCINLHTGYLPYNRGAYPNVWSIVNRTPAGATIHFMDEGIDTGDIIARRQATDEPTDTGETLYSKLEELAFQLFQDTWPLIQSGRAPRVPQPQGSGTHHRARDVELIDEIQLDKPYLAGQLIDVIRARTFSGHPGAYFVHEGRKVYLQLHLQYADERGD